MHLDQGHWPEAMIPPYIGIKRGRSNPKLRGMEAMFKRFKDLRGICRVL